MKYVVAVSGGVDSVVLLHMMQQLPEVELVVAHFDHGIRADSVHDAAFVEQLAKVYGLPFETKREELGEQASEALARDRRYAFLQEIALKYQGKIVTAHHADDIIETIAINHTRGTGWRGLAALDSEIVRPLLSMPKQTIIDYARRKQLEWNEDSTNRSNKYLRNRLREKLTALPETDKKKLLALHKKQLALKKQINDEIEALTGDDMILSRYFYTHAPMVPALELLRRVTKGLLTRPQLERALLAVKTARPGATYQAGAGVELRFTTRNFSVVNSPSN